MRFEACTLAALLAVASAASSLADERAGNRAGEWNFQVTLDGKPIGTHRFTVTADDGGSGGGGDRSLKAVSDAAFTVKLLGLTVYRYRHQAVEQWRGDCLRALDSSTDDDGAPSRVRATTERDALRVATEASPPAVSTVPALQSLPGCAMSFAYWNPAILSRKQLLNAQTGKYESVSIATVEDGMLAVRGSSVAATRWRIDGPTQPVDVWYTAQGEWVGLDSTVGGGRKLSYRLR